MSEEHPFAQYIRVLGKGRHGSRGLTETEAFDAMRMIVEDKVEPLQLGAFLMLMRVKEETAEEVAASVRAIKQHLLKVEDDFSVDLDWSSYAGKRRQLPWYLLAALLLSDNGIKVFMHGASGHTPDRIYTKSVLPKLGIPVCKSLDEARTAITETNFAYIDLEHLAPKLHEIIEMRPLLGLRSPVHTIARMLNPFNAPNMMQGIFHPGYQPTHQRAAVILGQPHMAVVKGEGGEIERNPDMACLIQTVHDGEMSDEEWPPMFKQRHKRPEDLTLENMIEVWKGRREDEYGVAAVVGTIAFSLFMMQKAANREEAETQAWELWNRRNLERF